jgi:hypothetical protein
MRQVTRRAEPSAQASLTLTGPAIDIATVWAALDAAAAHPAPGETRTLDQRRFDVAVDLCRQALESGAAAPGGSSSRPALRPSVYLFADAPTWAGLADQPIQLDGYGPIPPGVARGCFTDATWRAVVTDTVTAAARAVSDRGYRPSAKTRRLLQVRDRHCGFPGCPAAAWFCDADHAIPYEQGGCTDATNCGLLCRRHHRLKTFTRWTWTRGPDGSIEWTDPYGFRWQREPIRYQLPPPDDLTATLDDLEDSPHDAPGSHDSQGDLPAF